MTTTMMETQVLTIKKENIGSFIPNKHFGETLQQNVPDLAVFKLSKNNTTTKQARPKKLLGNNTETTNMVTPTKHSSSTNRLSKSKNDMNKKFKACCIES